jgi:predicted DNA-binding transcriptional regulator YafY
LRALRDVGVPIEFDSKAERYYLAGEPGIPASDFTADEAVKIVALANEFGRRRQLPFYDAAYDAARKIEPRFSASVQQTVRKLASAIRIRPSQLTHFNEKHAAFNVLLASIQQRRVIQIQYASLTEWETITTVLSPYHLLFCRHSWYVIGRSSLHRGIRIFNIVRIQSFEILKKRYVVPKRFDLDRYLGNAWLMMRHSGRLHHVVVRFAQQMAKNVAEVQWHRTQRTKFLADGSLEFQVKVPDFAEIQWWILGYGDQAEVLRPAKLRRIIAHRARNLAEMYRDDLEPTVVVPQRRFRAG